MPDKAGLAANGKLRRHLLLLDDDLGTRETFAMAFATNGWDVHVAATREEACRMAESVQFEGALLDLRLGDGSGLEALACFRRTQSCNAPAFIMTGFWSQDADFACVMLGARGCLAKPLDVDAVVQLFEPDTCLSVFVENLERSGSEDPPAVAQWVQLMIRALDSGKDVRTIDEWSRLAHVSRSTLECRCHTLGVTAKASLDLVRIILALREGQRRGDSPGLFIDADPRTVRRLFHSAGLDPDEAVSSPHWLDHQHYIVSAVAIRALKRALARQAS